jgi:ComF family protein
MIPVPLFKKKKIKRGFNQAEVIAAKLSGRLQIPYNAKILCRVKDTEPMKQLDHARRKKNLEKAFKISKNIVKLNKVLLVDDIYTTGSTIDECSTVLLAAGAEEIYFICLSIGVGC